jgi:hypothetical protein
MKSESEFVFASCKEEYVARVQKGWPSSIVRAPGSALS